MIFAECYYSIDFFLSPKNTEQTFELAEGLMQKSDITRGLIAFVLLFFVWSILAGSSNILSAVFYLWMMLLVPIMFLAAIVNVFIKIWRGKPHFKEQERTE